jgi:DNA-binding response OmpR family regulator
VRKVLIIDDDDDFRKNLFEIMTGAGYEAHQAASGGEAVEMAADTDFDVVLLDLIMPKISGADVLVELRKVSPRSKIIMITAFASIENAVDVVKRGATDYLSKPFKIEELLMRVRRALEEARMAIPSVNGDFDNILNSLSHPTRRAIIKLLSTSKTMRVMNFVKELDIADHTKVLFHLRMLKDVCLVEQTADKSYSLTGAGVKVLECLKSLEKNLRNEATPKIDNRYFL